MSAEAADWAWAHPSPWPRDIRAVIEGETFDPPPWNVVLGPVPERGGPAGAVEVGGIRVAEWGVMHRADMVFSVTKSYLGLLAAIALDRGRLPSLDAPVADTVAHPAFTSPRNRQVTWRMLLWQTSEWEGTLWGVPDTVDRDRQLSPTDDPTRFGRGTPLRRPGTYWDYNDTRVSALALALTLVFGRHLGGVLAEVHPAFRETAAWDWWGYSERSGVAIGDRTVECVVGGGHWGGGLRTSIEHDMALGRLVRDGGVAGGVRVVAEAALEELFRPCPLMPVYGGLWWLNTSRALYREAPETSVFAAGVGMNAIWVDRARDIVAAVHWIDEPAFPGFVEKVMAAAR